MPLVQCKYLMSIQCHTELPTTFLSLKSPFKFKRFHAQADNKINFCRLHIVISLPYSSQLLFKGTFCWHKLLVSHLQKQYSCFPYLPRTIGFGQSCIKFLLYLLMTIYYVYEVSVKPLIQVTLKGFLQSEIQMFFMALCSLYLTLQHGISLSVCFLIVLTLNLCYLFFSHIYLHVCIKSEFFCF